MRQFVVVTADRRRRLVPIESVAEIVPMLALETVHEGGACRGVANLRGEMLPVFDMTSPSAALHPSRYIVVARSGGLFAGLIVDDVDEVIGVDEDRIASRSLGGGRSVVMAQVGDALLPVIDTDEVTADAR